MHKFLKSFLLCVLGLALLLPPLQAKLKWINEAPLNGAYVTAPRAEFEFRKFLDNKFQPDLEHYLEDRIGFRSLLIRLRNQLSYSILNESRNSTVTIGRHKVLFEKYPIVAWQGTNFVGYKRVKFDAQMFRLVQDTLARHGVDLIFVVAPSKASFMPENLPAEAVRLPGTPDNYTAYTKALAAHGVHVLDFDRIFRQWRTSAPYPLFTSGGTHWSMYGGIRAGDSLLAYIRQLDHYRPIPFKIKNTRLTNILEQTDDDIAKLLNLAVPRPAEQLAYPTLTFATTQPGQHVPKALLIADSFGWTWINTFFSKCFSDQSSFWYYNHDIAWTGAGLTNKNLSIDQLKTRQNFLSHDVIIVMFTAGNMWQFDEGFCRQAFEVLHPIVASDQQRFNQIVHELRQKATWEEGTKDDFQQRVLWAANDTLAQERMAQ